MPQIKPHRCFVEATDDNAQIAVPVHAVTAGQLEAFLTGQPAMLQAQAAAKGFKANEGSVLVAFDGDGAVAQAVLGLGSKPHPMTFGALPAQLPDGIYRLAEAPDRDQAQAILVAFGLGAWQFDNYKTKQRRDAKLVVPPGADLIDASRVVRGVSLGRKLVNTPANDMGPDEVEAQAYELSEALDAEMEVICGQDLLEQNYPLIHTVGRAAAEDPRLIILRAGPADAPKLGLVGKGVTFDSGGLNIKPGSSMALMKKDMGGAACVLALFKMLVEAGINARVSAYLRPGQCLLTGGGKRDRRFCVSTWRHHQITHRPDRRDRQHRC